MSRPSSVALFLCLISSVCISCASTGTGLAAKTGPDILQRRVQTWLGMSRELLEKHWGIAQDTKDMGLGLRYLEYKAGTKKKKNKATDPCRVIFTIDISATVRGGQWSGDRGSCLLFVKEVPSLSPKQTLVSF